MAKTTAISKRAARCWQRLAEWYGTRLTESYGASMPPDWCEIIDRADNSTVTRGLAQIRSKYAAHPPTLPQFEQAMAPVKRDQGEQKPSTAEQLCTFVVHRYGQRLTPKQLRGPWTYLGKRFAAPDVGGRTMEGHGVEITGVIVPADGDAPGFRVMAQDMQADQFVNSQPPTIGGQMKHLARVVEEFTDSHGIEL